MEAELFENSFESVQGIKKTRLVSYHQFTGEKNRRAMVSYHQFTGEKNRRAVVSYHQFDLVKQRAVEAFFYIKQTVSIPVCCGL